MLKETIGPIIYSSFGQGAAIIYRDNTSTVCFVGNGTPCKFYEFNLLTGEKLFEYQLPSGDCVWGICKTDRGEVYFSNTEDRVLYRYHNGQVEQLGQNPANAFVFHLEQDENYVFGGTYPRSKLFSYHKKTSAFIDHGTMFEGEDYIRSIKPANGWVYLGSGSTQYLKRINLSTEQVESIYLEGISGERGFLDRIFVTDDYLLVSSNYTQLHIYDQRTLQKVDQFEFDNIIMTSHPTQPELYLYKQGKQLCSWNAITKQKSVLMSNVLPQGRVKAMEWIVIEDAYYLAFVTVNADVAIIALSDFSLNTYTLTIDPQPIINTVIEISKSGRLYAGGYHRGLAIYNIETNEVEGRAGIFPQTEGITFHGQDVYFGTYTHAHLYRYHEGDPLQFNSSTALSPHWIGHVEYNQDRPFALTTGEQFVFFGTTPDYGLHGGALAVWDTQLESLTCYPQIVENQSIVGLAYHNGLLYGSTSVWGGLGKPPVKGPAKLFVWDVNKKQKIAEFVPHIPDMDNDILFIGNIAFGPDGLLWGIIDGTIFAIDPVSYATVKHKRIYPTEYKHSKWRPLCLRFGQDGLLYTNVGNKLTIIHPDSLEHKQISDDAIVHMTIDHLDRIYYFIKKDIIRLTLEKPIFDEAPTSLHSN